MAMKLDFMIQALVLIFAIAYVILRIFVVYLSRKIVKNTKINRNKLLDSLGKPRDSFILGFFHPFCNAGGGGERVLWTAIHDIQQDYPQIISIVYTGDVDASKAEILEKILSRFQISLDPSRLDFVYLGRRGYVEDKSWPRLTLLGQSFGSLLLAWEAMSNLIPDVYFDTMGYAFTFPLVKKLCNIPVAAYVHYPTISTDMISNVNPNSRIKLVYYRLFAFLYSFVGGYADVVMTNSSWTRDHIDSLWGIRSSVVFPPCDTRELATLSLENREPLIISISQFRPEKQQHRQIESFAMYVKDNPEDHLTRLVLLGSSRNDEDTARIDNLKSLVQKHNLNDRIEFVINAPFPKLKNWLGRARIGLNTMWNEHFGIGCVEFLAAGVIPIVHASGGPKIDIVVPYKGQRTGYHANTNEEFAKALKQALSLPDDELLKMQKAGRALALEKFSDQVFKENWLRQMSVLFKRKND